MPFRFRTPSAPVAAALGGVAIGLAFVVWPAESALGTLPRLLEFGSLETLPAARALPRTSAMLAMEEARLHLDADRPWAAWRVLRDHVEGEDAAPPVALLAARAASEWGGWRQVRELLREQPWLAGTGDGEGFLLLGRAEEEAGERERAMTAYRAAAGAASNAIRGPAEARLGRLLRDAGEPRQAAEFFASSASHLPDIADWLLALEAEARAAAGEAVPVRVGSLAGQSPAVRIRRATAEARGWLAAGDTARAVAGIEREAGVLASQGAVGAAAGLALLRAPLLEALDREAEARELLRGVAWEPSVPNPTRVRAAALLNEIATHNTAAEELARAAAYEAARRPGVAARALRNALNGAIPDDGTMRLRLGKLLFDAGDMSGARPALLGAAARLEASEAKAEAEFYAARARYRKGDKKGGLAELRTLAAQRPGTAAAGSALFLLGDASAKIEDAISLYRRAAAIPASPDAREALFRVGDRELKTKDPAAAIRAWSEYVNRYPRGEETAEIAFRTGLLLEERGQRAAAREMFAAATRADPLSYYAIQAGSRIGVDVLETVLEVPRPWPGLASDPVDAARALHRLDLLAEAGLEDEWDEEREAAIRSFRQRPAALVSFAEGLRDRNHPLEAILLGRELLELRNGTWDVRLLRLVFPFPYRGLIEREAERAGADPMLLAGLIRQESTFRAGVHSRVGAAGLAQIMPATGRWLAPKIGVDEYEDRLLLVPEVNVRMGARYLADLVERYDGAQDLALAGYNAGPSRASRWRRELGHAQDVDAFRERIPYAETRHYVKVVLRNAAVYQKVYGN